MANNSGGPWGGGGGSGGNNNDDDRREQGGRRPSDPGIPEIDQIVNKGREQLRVLMGGRGGSGGGGRSGGPGGGFEFTRGTAFLGAGLNLLRRSTPSSTSSKPGSGSISLNTSTSIWWSLSN